MVELNTLGSPKHVFVGKPFRTSTSLLKWATKTHPMLLPKNLIKKKNFYNWPTTWKALIKKIYIGTCSLNCHLPLVCCDRGSLIFTPVPSTSVPIQPVYDCDNDFAKDHRGSNTFLKVPPTHSALDQLQLAASHIVVYLCFEWLWQTSPWTSLEAVWLNWVNEDTSTLGHFLNCVLRSQWSAAKTQKQSEWESSCNTFSPL